MSSEFSLTDKDIGKKIFEIEEERVIVIKTRVIANDRDEAFSKYLECNDTRVSEDHKCKHNGDDIVNHFAKDYGGYKDTKEVGRIIKEQSFPNDDEDDSYDIKEEY